MTRTTQAVTDRLYVTVQAFYARQLQLLDTARLAEYGATYTEDAEFTHSPAKRPPAHSRDEIVRAQVESRRAAGSDPVQRRHWITMIDLEEGSDGELRSTAYCLMAQIPTGQPPQFSSSVFHDVLVASPSGDLRVRSRLVAHD